MNSDIKIVIPIGTYIHTPKNNPQCNIFEINFD